MFFLLSPFVKIDENRCTVVQNRPCRPSARRPVRPPGPGPAEPIYIKLPIDRHGRLLLVWASTEPCGPISDQISCFRAKQKSDPGHKSKFFLKMPISSSSNSLNIWHIWEDRSQKVNNDKLDLIILHGNFWPVMSQAVRKPCPRGGVPVPPFPPKRQIATNSNN